MFNLESIEIIIFAAVFGVVWSYHLTDEGMIFGFLHDPPRWAEFIRCEYCTAGQAGLWVYLISQWQSYDFWVHLATVIGSIFVVILIKKAMNYD